MSFKTLMQTLESHLVGGTPSQHQFEAKTNLECESADTYISGGVASTEPLALAQMTDIRRQLTETKIRRIPSKYPL